MATQPPQADRIGELLADPPANPIKRLLAILRSDPRAMAVAFVGTVVASLAALAQPALTGGLVAALQTMDTAELVRIGGLLVGAALIASLFTAVGTESTRARSSEDVRSAASAVGAAKGMSARVRASSSRFRIWRCIGRPSRVRPPAQRPRGPCATDFRPHCLGKRCVRSNGRGSLRESLSWLTRPGGQGCSAR